MGRIAKKDLKRSRDSLRRTGALLVALVAAAPAAADVVLDGSIGNAGAGPVASVPTPGGGTEFQILESDGQRSGSNLFHSFDQFDLTASEVAVYSGDASITNLITRVTGGPSSIDGVIQSDISGANLYFVNPAGVLFGENAQVDLSGSFYVSTADQVLFEDGAVFETALGNTGMLSVANATGFGFLDAPAPIRIQGSQIELAFGHNMGLIGGDLEIRGDRSDGAPGFVSARSGRIDLASLRSSGEVYVNADVDGDDVGDGVFLVENVSERGDIVIAGNVSVNTSGINRDPFQGVFEQPGPGSGAVNVYGRNLTIDDAAIETLTVTDEDAGDVMIDLTGDFVARSVEGGKQSGIIAGTGLNIERRPGDVLQTLLFGSYGNAQVSAGLCATGFCGVRYTANGNAGDVNVKARNVRFENGGRITVRSDTLGDAGTIRLDVADSILFTGVEENGERSGLSSTADSTGNPGAIEILSPTATLAMEDQAAIVIQNSADGLATSAPGRITIDVARIEMSGDSRIDSSTRGAGPGGTIDLVAREGMTLRGRTSAEEFTGVTTLSQPGSSGAAGDIRIETPNLDLFDGAEISARPVGIGSTGDAGSLEFQIANRLTLTDSSISTESETPAGGNIEVFFGNDLRVEDSAISASVTAGQSAGGNVTLLSNPGSSVVLENGSIEARADAGLGGNILIETGLLLQDPNSLISASSNSGIDGTVVISAPDGQLVALGEDLDTPVLDASALLSEPCAARRPGGANSLVVSQRDGVPLNVESVLPGFLPRSVYGQLGEALADQPSEEEGIALASIEGSERFVPGRSARCFD